MPKINYDKANTVLFAITSLATIFALIISYRPLTMFLGFIVYAITSFYFEFKDFTGHARVHSKISYLEYKRNESKPSEDKERLL